jgi:outer membrane protein TolC
MAEIINVLTQRTEIHRNRSWKIQLISILLSMFFTVSANSQPDSLSFYLETAAKNNPLVLQRFTEYETALQRTAQAGALSDPELSLGVFLSPMELVSGSQVADIRLMQMFPWFGVLRYAKDEMSMMAKAKFELFRDARLQIFFDVQRTFYELYKIRKEISISEKNIEILKTIERLALVKFKAASPENSGAPSSTPSLSPGVSQNSNSGSASMQSMGNNGSGSGITSVSQTSPPMQTGQMSSSSGNSGLADLYRIEMESGELEYNVSLLKTRADNISAQFNNYLNRPAGSPVLTPEIIVPDSLGISILSASDSMLANNPMLNMLDYEKQSIEARKKMVSRMSYPMVGAGFNYSLINKNVMSVTPMNGRDMIMPMVTITLPVYRKKYNARKAETELQRTAASQSYSATSNSLQMEFYQELRFYNDARRRVKLYENQLQLASGSLDLLMKSFSVSSSGLTDVLRMVQQKLEFELKQIEAIADLNISVAKLRRLGNLEINGNKI